MISIAEAISDLLFVRDTVVVPGLGAFVRKPRSAKVDLVLRILRKTAAQGKELQSKNTIPRASRAG